MDKSLNFLLKLWRLTCVIIGNSRGPNFWADSWTGTFGVIVSTGCRDILCAFWAILFAAIKAGVSMGDNARITEAGEGKRPFRVCWWTWCCVCWCLFSSSKKCTGVDGAVGVASEHKGVASEASEPSFEKKALIEPLLLSPPVVVEVPPALILLTEFHLLMLKWGWSVLLRPPVLSPFTKEATASVWSLGETTVVCLCGLCRLSSRRRAGFIKRKSKKILLHNYICTAPRGYFGRDHHSILKYFFCVLCIEVGITVYLFISWTISKYWYSPVSIQELNHPNFIQHCTFRDNSGLDSFPNRSFIMPYRILLIMYLYRGM